MATIITGAALGVSLGLLLYTAWLYRRALSASQESITLLAKCVELYELKVKDAAKAKLN